MARSLIDIYIGITTVMHDETLLLLYSSMNQSEPGCHLLNRL